MSQPVKTTIPGDPANAFAVLDNGAPGNGGVAGGIGYDNCLNGAVAQGKNVFTNGTIPDFVNLQSSVSLKLSTTQSIGYKNPS